MIDCPTCEGEGQIYSGSGKGQAPSSKKKGKDGKSKVFTFRSDSGLQKDLAKAKDKKAKPLKCHLLALIEKNTFWNAPHAEELGNYRWSKNQKGGTR